MLLPVVVLWALLGAMPPPPSQRPSRRSTRSSSSASSTATWRVSKTSHRVAGDCVALVGGVLIILAVAVGLTNYLVNAQIPTQMIEWTQATSSRRWLFLLALNVFLLLVGTVMDIFSAIVVVVPLILPLADAYQITYVHPG